MADVARAGGAGYDGHVRLLGADGTLVAVADAHAGRLTLARVFC